MRITGSYLSLRPFGRKLKCVLLFLTLRSDAWELADRINADVLVWHSGSNSREFATRMQALRHVKR